MKASCKHANYNYYYINEYNHGFFLLVGIIAQQSYEHFNMNYCFIFYKLLDVTNI